MKKILLCLILVLLLLFVMSFVSVILMHDLWHDSEKTEDLLYYDKIVEYVKEGKNIKIYDIFDFEFDYIYMPSQKKISGGNLKETIGVEYEIKDVDSTLEILHIYFISGNKVVYDFNYAAEYLSFFPLDKIIFIEDAIFEGKCDNDICSLVLFDKN